MPHPRRGCGRKHSTSKTGSPIIYIVVHCHVCHVYVCDSTVVPGAWAFTPITYIYTGTHEHRQIAEGKERINNTSWSCLESSILTRPFRNRWPINVTTSNLVAVCCWACNARANGFSFGIRFIYLSSSKEAILSKSRHARRLSALKTVIQKFGLECCWKRWKLVWTLLIMVFNN